MNDPISPVGSGRDEAGRFTQGNKAARGNPANKAAQRLRTALLAAVTAADIRAVVKKLIALAKGGDVAAARELLNRTLGLPSPTELLERIAALEERIGADPLEGSGLSWGGMENDQ